MTFKKGDPAINRNGRPKINHTIVDYIRKELEIEDKQGINKAQVIVKRLVDMSASVDDELSLKATREILDRLVGKPIQAINQKIETDAPVVTFDIVPNRAIESQDN